MFFRMKQEKYLMEESHIVDQIEEFIQEKVEKSGANGLVIGLSGGLDSALTATMAVRAVGPEEVKALIMPGNPSKEKNIQDARELADKLGIEALEIDIEDSVKSFEKEMPFEIGKKALGNVRARSRMIYSYTVANKENLIVLGTGNRTEFLLGYFTKYGDGATDIAPLLDLYKTEVKEVARHVGLDEKFIQKEPTAGLWKGQTDEGEIGASYEVADKVLKGLIDREKSLEEVSSGLDAERGRVEDIVEMYRNSEHKRKGVQGLEIFDERN